MGLLRRLFGKPDRVEAKQCQSCSRQMEVLGSGSGSIALSREEMMSGNIGGAEQCWECERVYCDRCYPSRPPNTCACGRGRDARREIGGVVYHGSLRLMKVRYLP